jgi:hypothetical protein
LISLMLPFCGVRAACAGFEYPSALLEAYDADGSCWTGMDPYGQFPVLVGPERWLVGPPPSHLSAVTLLEDEWVHVAFSGIIVDGDGNDVLIDEPGRAGERALVFLTDGAGREHLLGEAVALGTGGQGMTRIGFDIAGVALPFAPRAVRVVAVDKGGGSPGFDVANVRARISHSSGLKAGCPHPHDGADGIAPDPRLVWSPGGLADKHLVRLSRSAADVDSEAAIVAHPPQPQDANTLQLEGLELGATYYWRVDELRESNPAVTRIGDPWSFTVVDRITVDDFESYDPWEWRLDDTWLSRGTIQAHQDLEFNVFNSCAQAMSIYYLYNSGLFTEVMRTIEPAQDWTQSGAAVLQLLFYGRPGNGTKGQMYVTLGDGVSEQAVPYVGRPVALATAGWHTWHIPLVEFDAVDLTHVTSMAIGLRQSNGQPTARGNGVLYFDDIALRPRLCPAPDVPPADLTADCRVDYRDLDELGRNWLAGRFGPHAIAAPNEPVLWYRFDGDTQDSAGQAHAFEEGRPDYVPGVVGQAIHFRHKGDAAVLTDATPVFSHIRDAITVTFWQYGEDSPHLNDTLCCSNYVYGQSNAALAIHLGIWGQPGRYQWDCGAPRPFANRLVGHHRRTSEWAGRWNHWAFTKDVHAGPDRARGTMEIYLNGVLYDRVTGADVPIEGIESLEVGTGWYGHYDGLVDDFRIYDYALTPREVAYLATLGTGVSPEPTAVEADLNRDGRVDLTDYAILASEWLDCALWP